MSHRHLRMNDAPRGWDIVPVRRRTIEDRHVRCISLCMYRLVCHVSLCDGVLSLRLCAFDVPCLMSPGLTRQVATYIVLPYGVRERDRLAPIQAADRGLTRPTLIGLVGAHRFR